MKRLSIVFAIVLIASAASVGLAGMSGEMTSKYKADLSGEPIPQVETRATGEAIFELGSIGMEGAGAGGLAVDKDPLAPDRDMGYVGPGMDERAYEGIIDRGRPEYGYGAGGGTITGEFLRYKLNVKRIENVTAAHLHMGGTSAAEGPVVASLYLGPRKAGQYSGMLSQGTITEKDLQGPLAGKSLDDLVAAIDSGDIYVNVHTLKHPEGEIRGLVSQRG